MWRPPERSGTLCQPSKCFRDTLGRFGNLLEASGTLWDALGAFWRHPGRSGTFWKPSGGLRDAPGFRDALGTFWRPPGRSGKLLEASGTLWDARKLTCVASGKAQGFDDPRRASGLGFLLYYAEVPLSLGVIQVYVLPSLTEYGPLARTCSGVARCFCRGLAPRWFRV